MSLKEYLRKQLLIFVVLVTCISFFMGLTGLIFDSERTFTYAGFFAPIIYAFLYVLLDFISYSRRELTLKQYLFRCFLQFVAYEAIVLSYTRFVTKASYDILLVLAFSVPIIYVISYVMIWFIDSHRAKEMKKVLYEYQKNHRSEQ